MATTVALPMPVAATARPARSAICFALADALAVSASLGLAVLVRYVFGGDYELAEYWRLFPVLGLFLTVYAAFGLYPGIATGAVAEMRKLALATTVVFVLMGTLLFLFRETTTYSRSVFFLGWLIALAAAPLARAAARWLAGRRDWWGYPVFVFGSGALAERVVTGLREHPELGLRPVAVFGEEDNQETVLCGVPVVAGMRWAPLYAGQYGVRSAVFAASDAPHQQALRFVESHADVFSRVYFVPQITGLSSLGIETRDMGDMLTLEVRQNLVRPSCQAFKRMLDQGVGLVLALLFAPLLAVIAALVVLESRGSAFYGHRRIGLQGRQFKMWKFRTMWTDGSRILAEHFERHPEAKLEWEQNQKLHDDPRVTPLGRLLRRTSLDELPQLWNILRGEMSLVGPRPIVQDEVVKYGRYFDLYTKVMPGLTGLWQVSGRSRTTYERRVELDSYYVRNWSLWLDAYLLARTMGAVVKGDGAY